jgi:hypothetical protein
MLHAVLEMAVFAIRLILSCTGRGSREWGVPRSHCCCARDGVCRSRRGAHNADGSPRAAHSHPFQDADGYIEEEVPKGWATIHTVHLLASNKIEIAGGKLISQMEGWDYRKGQGACTRCICF